MRSSPRSFNILLFGCLALAASACIPCATAQAAAPTSLSADRRNFDASQFGQDDDITVVTLARMA
jgi:hypothetical protein